MQVTVHESPPSTELPVRHRTVRRREHADAHVGAADAPSIPPSEGLASSVVASRSTVAKPASSAGGSIGSSGGSKGGSVQGTGVVLPHPVVGEMKTTAMNASGASAANETRRVERE